jgi:hypothetical protein
MVQGMNTYRITVTVGQRSDLDIPSSVDEALSLVRNLLSQGDMLEVLSVEPQDKQTKEIKWG